MTTTRVVEEEVIEEQPQARTVAIFVKNRAGKNFEDKLGAFESMIVGDITDMGFQTISPEDTAFALQSFAGTEDGKEIKPTELDQHLKNKSSAIRLSQMLNADYLFIASISTYGQNNQHLKRADLGIDRFVTNYKLRVSYKILDGNDGKSLTAGNVDASKQTQQSDSLQSIDSDVINTLIAEASQSLASKMKIKGATLTVADVKLNTDLPTIVVKPSIQGLRVPDITVDKNGQYQIGTNTLPLQAIDVDVELDGAIIGTAPGKLQASPGLHTIKVHHPNFKTWERVINIRPGMTLNVPLVMTDQANVKMKEMSAFLAQLKANQSLSDAQAEKIKGFAQMLHQSGYRIDQHSDTTVEKKINIDKKSDVKIDTDLAPTITQNNIERQNTTGSVWPQ
ncbi:PEGA domain-containing protein [Poriferisphaera corsica]|uniref:PEGA domain-containing protein n=1 Tax=Poriferisphaera corsica TaxID=2528020 RepID=UPI00190CE9D3|nr:PEGA domain-containing protein [Poriferisphaera corsica]